MTHGPYQLNDFLEWASSEALKDIIKICAWMALGSVLTMIAMGRKRT